MILIIWYQSSGLLMARLICQLFIIRAVARSEDWLAFVEDLHLKIGKIPVYSASPWIESLAHTVYDEYHNIVSIYYTMIQYLGKIFITKCIAGS